MTKPWCYKCGRQANSLCSPSRAPLCPSDASQHPALASVASCFRAATCASLPTALPAALAGRPATPLEAWIRALGRGAD